MLIGSVSTVDSQPGRLSLRRATTRCVAPGCPPQLRAPPQAPPWAPRGAFQPPTEGALHNSACFSVYVIKLTFSRVLMRCLVI